LEQDFDTKDITFLPFPFSPFHICNNLLFVQQRVLTKKGFESNNTVFSIYFYLLMTMYITTTSARAA